MIKDSLSQARQLSSSDALSKTASTKSWKKLEQKYLCYISLLKTRVSQYKQKRHQQRTGFGIQIISVTLRKAIQTRQAFALHKIGKLAKEDVIFQRWKHIPLGDLSKVWDAIPKSILQNGHSRSIGTTQSIQLLKFAQFWINKQKSIRKDAFRRIKASKQFAPLGSIQERLTDLKMSFDLEYLTILSSKVPTSSHQRLMQFLIRDNARISLRNREAEQKVTLLQRQLEINNEIRESDIRKKTESLERIAFELHEKDELLRQLEKELEYYDEKERCSNGRLLTPSTEAQYRMETMKLEQQNERLIDAMREREVEHREQLKGLKQEVAKLQLVDKRLIAKEKELDSLFEKNFSLQYECSCLRKENADLNVEIEQLRSKTYRMDNSCSEKSSLVSFYARIYSVIRNINTSPADKVSNIEAVLTDKNLWVGTSSSEPSKLSALTVIEQILEQEQHSIAYQTTLGQFDQSTKAKIEEIGNKIKRLKIGTLKDLVKSRSSPADKDECQIAYNSTPNLFDSVFQAFPDHPEEKMPKPTPESVPSTIKTTQDHVGHSQSSKSIAKLESIVLTLKDRQMAVRNIIFQLLRSLQLKQKCGLCRKLPKEADSILAVLFDLFEYSEEEKIQIFRRRESKGFLGIF